MIAKLLWKIDFLSGHLKDEKYKWKIIWNKIKNFVTMHG
jgi:hypothetical protein